MTPSHESTHVKNKLRYGLHSGLSIFFEYETSKVVQINSMKVGFIHRLIQLVIVTYIIGWVIVYKKGYQDFETVVSGVTTKVKGVQYTNLTGTSIGARIWDVVDYVVPPQENNAFFITTNAVITSDQIQGSCSEDPSIAPCISDSDCPEGKPQMMGNGINTGRCINSTQSLGSKSCEILAWCPVEVDRLPKNSTIFPNAENFTVLIKNSIEFPKFNVKRRNIPEYTNSTWMQLCHYQSVSDPNCPVFRIGDILRMSGVPHLPSIANQGGVVAVKIDWDCNLDWSISSCNPVYSFSRLDDSLTRVARGWNFRYANYYKSNDGAERRILVKAYGIRFIIYVTGQAGKFNIIPLTMNLGSGVALLGLATVMCDIIVLHLLNKRSVYRTAKFQTMQDDDAYKPMDEEEDKTLNLNSGDGTNQAAADTQSGYGSTLR